ncbi:hypothetical protein SAMN04489712_103520 [Thermomonospora echinospora]|uniref:DUF6801 domain-containing protein n=2 Tax=Thermomonospora echinospora TaxID=1992 RepID=A0A1H5Y217_9ACTN|nr:hypothetical protein SAMN04489712_103520 [Thermomonospora echinospora]
MRISVSCTSRGALRTAALGAIVVAAGMLPGALPAAGAQTADASLAYSCRFPQGARQVKVKVAGEFPSSARVGRPLRPGKMNVTVTVPQAALGDLSGLGAATVTGTAGFVTMITQGTGPSPVRWPGLAVKPAAVPRGGDLVLTASGPVPAVKVGKPGPVIFTLGQLALDLKPRKADGSATSPDALAVPCTLNPGQNSTLATVFASPDGSGPGRQDRPERGNLRQGPSPDRSLAAADIPADCEELGEDIGDPFALTVCAYMTGYSNVKKLNSAMLFPYTIINIVGTTFYDCSPPGKIRFCIPFKARLNSGGKAGFPPARSTFLTYGFMPTTATVEVTQATPFMDILVELDFILDDEDGDSSRVTATAKFGMRVHEAEVNGTPLDVGPNCGLAEPMETKLSATAAEYSPDSGGPLAGEATIPPFAGCGVGEDLDPIFTASISGPGNYVKMTQGNGCTAQSGFGCPPVKPVPLR